LHFQLDISTIENLFDLSENTSSIDYEGKTFKIKWLDEYHSDQTLYFSRFALLNNKILIVACSGSPSPLDIKKVAFKLSKIYEQLKLTDIDVIWDFRNIQSLTLKVRRQIVQLNNFLAKYWRYRFLIFPPKYQTFVKIYKFVYQHRVENMFFAGSVKQAMNAILSEDLSSLLDDDGMAIFENINKSDLLKKSKEELVEIIEQYHNDNKGTSEKMLEAISQISWGGRFKPYPIEVSENDVAFDLQSAFLLLQNDLAEIIKEYKELNINLELKVAERIVYFIDKESNLRAILDNSDRLTCLLNNRFELIDFNSAFSDEIRSRYGVMPKVDQSILDIFADEETREAWRGRFQSALDGKPGIFLDQVVHDEHEQVLEIKTFPIKEIGKIKGVSVFIEDITELKNSQFKLIEKNRDLEKVNSELDSFVYRVSHDLRAPLTSILGLIGLMKIETSHEKVSEYIDLQEKSIQKLDQFIKEIMNLSRNSRLGITVSPINLKGLLDEIFEEQNFVNIDKKVERKYNIQKGLSLFTDRSRLSIILNNLISNAVKYANPHEKSVMININAYAENSNCVITVSDNGIGISEIYLPKIFEMFFRATEEFAGSGLGLYIVKETVQKLKGKITVKSKIRQGTTFQVVLPNMKSRFDAAPKLDD
jgi:PAS domain S-box-containing protein